ncbi:ChaB family protein [Actinocatenispora sera]|nr:ChaB family protein [Actinocatenispora sera]
MPAMQELPLALQQSSRAARATWLSAHEAAIRRFGDGRRAYEFAREVLRRGFDRVGDHWEERRPGPMDEAPAGRSIERVTPHPTSRPGSPGRHRR